MSEDPEKFIRDADFIFENISVIVVANRNNPQIDLPGMKVGPFQEGKEYELKFWVAKELEKSGIVRIRIKEPLDLMILNKIHWKELVKTSQKLTSLPSFFYPKLRRYLKELSEIAIKKPEKRVEYEKAKNNSNDIVQMRLKKIISLASSGRDQTGQILRTLTKEEKYAYDHLHKFISEWKNEILKMKEDDKT